MQASQPEIWHGTTILTVRKGGKVVILKSGKSISIQRRVIFYAFRMWIKNPPGTQAPRREPS